MGFAVPVLRPQNDQTRLVLVGHVGTRVRHDNHAVELAALRQIGAQPLLQLVGDLVRLTSQLVGTVARKLG
ncbi:MAG: hypothetical protein ACK559_32115, partial [bacterium]